MDSKKTHFGFKQVDVDSKSQLVKEIFSNVASKYDLMNDLMSFGIHRNWKNKMIENILAKLKKNGLIEKKGEKKNAIWIIKLS